MREEMTSLNGQQFLVRHWGDISAPKILMLHGFPEYGGAWEGIATRLSNDYHCIVPDQRGYGRSWAPEGVENYTTSALVSDMSALIGDDSLIVIGHDWGASIAYALAASHPEQVERLIIMNGVHPAPFSRELAKGEAQAEASQYINFLRLENSHDLLSKDNYAGMMQLFSAKMDFSWFNEDTKAAYLREWSRPGRLRAMIDWYRASTLAVADPGKPLENLPELPVDKLKIRCPHLLIWGMNDIALLHESTIGLEEFAPDLTRVEIEGADHWLHHQKPDEVAQEIRDWLAQT